MWLAIRGGGPHTTPQAVDSKELPVLGADWRADNPYRVPPAQPKAVTIGSSAYNQKKAACVQEMDGYFIGKVRRGVTRNGAVYMPPFDGVLQQEAVWAIESYLETRREKPL